MTTGRQRTPRGVEGAQQRAEVGLPGEELGSEVAHVRGLHVARGDSRDGECARAGLGEHGAQELIGGPRPVSPRNRSAPHLARTPARPCRSFPGPNTNTSDGSIIVYLEAQARYLRQALHHVRDRGAAAIDVRSEVAAASDREVQSRFAGTAWTRCNSWYRDRSGRVVANWPGYMREYVAKTKTLNPDEYTFVGH